MICDSAFRISEKKSFFQVKEQMVFLTRSYSISILRESVVCINLCIFVFLFIFGQLSSRIKLQFMSAAKRNLEKTVSNLNYIQHRIRNRIQKKYISDRVLEQIRFVLQHTKQ